MDLVKWGTALANVKFLELCQWRLLARRCCHSCLFKMLERKLLASFVQGAEPMLSRCPLPGR